MATEREIAAARSQDRQRLLEGQKRRNALWSVVIGLTTQLRTSSRS